MSTKLLNTGAWLLSAIILLALVFTMFVSGKYKTSNTSVADISQEEASMINYAELVSLLENPPTDLIIIDLRDADSFAAGHIPGAVSMPAETMLQKKNLSFLGSKKHVLLYGALEQDAMVAAMILAGKGINTRCIPGGYEQIFALAIRDGLHPAYRYYRSEKARFDYPRFMQTATGGQAGSSAAKPIVPIIKTDVTTVQGGC